MIFINTVTAELISTKSKCFVVGLQHILKFRSTHKNYAKLYCTANEFSNLADFCDRLSAEIICMYYLHYYLHLCFYAQLYVLFAHISHHCLLSAYKWLQLKSQYDIWLLHLRIQKQLVILTVWAASSRRRTNVPMTWISNMKLHCTVTFKKVLAIDEQR